MILFLNFEIKDKRLGLVDAHESVNVSPHLTAHFLFYKSLIIMLDPQDDSRRP